MKTIINVRVPVIFLFFLITTVFAQAQSSRRSTDLRSLNKGIIAARARVTMNERKIAVADSLIDSGTRLLTEARAETRAIETERRKLDKDYAAGQKPLARLTTSRNREESTKARVDLKALSTQYRSDIKILQNRSRESAKKMTKGNNDLKKGKSLRKSATDSLKASKAALREAQARYDAVYFSGGNPDPNKNMLK